MMKLPSKMQAAVFEGQGILSVKDVPLPTIEEDNQALVQIEAASICGTDIHVLSVPPRYEAPPNIILGHEYVGKIVDLGDKVNHFNIGDRVVVAPNISCGKCFYCLNNLPHMCREIRTLGLHIDGAFAQYGAVPAGQLYRISEDISANTAACVEPLSCVIQGTTKLKIQPGETVVVLGAGPIGLLFTMIFKASGAGRIIVSEKSNYRGKYAREVGADIVVNPQEADLEETIKKETDIGADVVVDAVGELFDQTLNLVRRAGRILLFGMNEKALVNIAQSLITRNELQIFGAYVGTAVFTSAIRILESQTIDVKKIITHVIPLHQIHEGIEILRNQRGIKVIIKPWGHDS